MSGLIFYTVIYTTVMTVISSQRNFNCDSGYECIHKNDCDEHQENVNKINILRKNFGRYSKEYKELLTKESQGKCK